jgi:hypothetical protein
MNKEKLVDEIKILFEIMYLPVAIANNRYSGEDFIKVGVDIMRESKRNNVFDEHKYLIANTLIDEFDEKITPKLNKEQKDNLAYILTGKSTFIKI